MSRHTVLIQPTALTNGLIRITVKLLQRGILSALWNPILDDDINGRHILSGKRAQRSVMYNAPPHTWRAEKWVKQPTETQPVPFTDVEISPQHQAQLARICCQTMPWPSPGLCTQGWTEKSPCAASLLIMQDQMMNMSRNGTR